MFVPHSAEKYALGMLRYRSKNPRTPKSHITIYNAFQSEI